MLTVRVGDPPTPWLEQSVFMFVLCLGFGAFLFVVIPTWGFLGNTKENLARGAPDPPDISKKSFFEKYNFLFFYINSVFRL